jgi:hypothetical protein
VTHPTVKSRPYLNHVQTLDRAMTSQIPTNWQVLELSRRGGLPVQTALGWQASPRRLPLDVLDQLTPV